MDEVRITTALKEIETQIAAVNEALKKGLFAEVNSAFGKLKGAEKVYASLVAQQTYETLAKSKTPLVDAAKMYEFGVVGHTENKTNGITTSVSINKDAKQKIDLLELCRTQGMSVEWSYACERACQLFVLDTAIDLGFTANQVKTMIDSIFLSKKAAQYYASKENTSIPDPTSNNSLNKALNEVISMTIGEDYHSNTYDVKYIKRVFNKKGKQGLVLACGKPSYFRQILLDILFRITTGSTYGVAFDMKKDDKKVEGILFAEIDGYKPADAAPATEAPAASPKSHRSGKNGKKS